MKTRTLGLIGILCSPFLTIEMNVEGIFEHYNASHIGEIFGLIYMTGWLCSIIGLYKLDAAGKRGRIVLIIQMALLTIGDLWNIYSSIDPACNTTLFKVIDIIGWPFDNVFMLATGTAVVLAKQLHGWKRYVPLFTGMWFPLTLVLTRIIFGSGYTELMITSLYSMFAWSLLGLTVYMEAREREILGYALVKGL